MTSKVPARFTDLKLIDPLLKALAVEGYEHPTPIQAQAIPVILEQNDLLGVAQTGTGKTAAFALPILQLLSGRSATAEKGLRRPIRTLVLTPTRELAAQIGESFDRYGAHLGMKNTVIFGGVGQGAQVTALRSGIDILVATPGRLLDLIEQRHVSLAKIEIFVLDEADRMLDMGFIHDVKRLIKLLPKERHSLFFSATMPPDIQRLAGEILTRPVKVEVTPIATPAEKIDQAVYFCETPAKRRLLEGLMNDKSIQRALVFTRTKHGADRVAKFLNAADVPAEAIHGNKSQNNRIRALNNFKEGQIRVLVATDIAARGIDIDGVTHVINYELPNIPESYVHRIGRTARAGKEGIALSFCASEERAYLRDIERLIRMNIRIADGSSAAASAIDRPMPPRQSNFRPGGQGQSQQRGGQQRSSGGQQRSNQGQQRRAAPQQRSAGAPQQRSDSQQRSDRPQAQGARQDPRRQDPRRQDSRRPDSRRPAPSGQQPQRSSAPKTKTESPQQPEARSWWKKLTSK